jgi:hypothetical protein
VTRVVFLLVPQLHLLDLAGPAQVFSTAADLGYCYHQQYLSSNKNPYGYCPDHGTGVSCPIGVVNADG